MATRTVEGLRDLEYALRELPKATARSTLQRVLKKRAEPIRETWKDVAPRDRGDYAQSIVDGPNSRLTSRQKRDAKKEGKYFAEHHIGTSDPAGQQQEFGNINHPAQPSGRPAWEATQEMTLEGIGEDFWEELDRTRERAARKAARIAAKG